MGIIIQARTGSTRLPGKMVMPFDGDRTILEIIVNRFKGNYPIVLATTTAAGDDPLATLGEKLGISVYRGSENDVLSRFVEAAERFNFDTVVRVCADNPFLNLELLEQLIDVYDGHAYSSFRYSNGKPTILGHLGLFCEITTLEALKKAHEDTDEALYLEHVTNYLYNHPETFDVQLYDLPNEIKDYDGIRLTVDTFEDFQLTQRLYRKFGNESTIPKVCEMLDYIRSNKVLLSAMQQEIELNSK